MTGDTQPETRDGWPLDTLLGGDVSIAWYEAVALVLEVIDQCPKRTDRALMVPELNQIHLSIDGQVRVTGGARSEEPVRRLGQLLLALLTSADAPVQLRLQMAQATAPSPVYQSIAAFSDAVGFFERPERAKVLLALAARVPARSMAAATEPLPTLDTLAPLPSDDAPVRRAKKPRSKTFGHSWRVAAAAVVVVLLGAEPIRYAWMRGAGRWSRSQASTVVDRASDKVAGALLSGASLITDSLGLGRLVATAGEDPVLALDPPPSLPSTPHAASVTTVMPVEDAPSPMAFDLDPQPDGPAPSAVALAESPSADPVAVHAAPDQNIYALGSGRVSPPIGIRPQMARQLPADVDRNRLGRVELVIGPEGSVESAKLLGPPRTVQDGLFLSVAKAWTFQPALKDGMPVRYRKIIWIALP